MNIKIESPIVIIPNLRNLAARFEMDFGQIEVKSEVVEEKNRWVNFPEKMLFVTKYLVYNKNMRWDYFSGKENESFDTIFNADTLDVFVTMVNGSNFLKEPEAKPVDKGNYDSVRSTIK